MKKVGFVGLLALFAWPLDALAQEAHASAAAPASAPASDAEPGPHAGWKGINVGIFPSGGLPTVGGAYFLDDSASLRLDLGLDLNKPGPGQDVLFGFSVEGGYRMYIVKSGRLAPFIQPGLFFAKNAARGDFAKNMVLQANFGIGGEFFVTDNLSVGAQTGAGLQFANEFKSFRFATGTTGAFVSLYW